MRKLSLFLAGLFTACALVAQSDRGTITGTVTDSSGALIPNVPIVLTNTQTGTKTDTVTTGTGNYTLPALSVGTYSLSVSYPGFSKYEQTGIEVQVAVTARVDVVLKIGSATESVEVTGGATLLKPKAPSFPLLSLASRLMSCLSILESGLALYGIRFPSHN